MKPIKLLLIGLVILFYWAGPVLADYTLFLKNGRTVTVEAYREGGSMIIFSSHGGEISIPKEEVKSIIPVRGHVARTDLPEVEYVPGETSAVAPDQETAAPPSEVPPLATKEKVLTPEEIRAEERAKEEREYQKKTREITERIKVLRFRYALAVRRPPGPEPSLLDSPAAIRARTADLNSRLKDAIRRPEGPSDRGDVRLEQPSPFTGAPPTIIYLKPGRIMKRVKPPLAPYSPKEKKLSQLRMQMIELRRERDRLIQEMREKNFDSGHVFLE